MTDPPPWPVAANRVPDPFPTFGDRLDVGFMLAPVRRSVFRLEIEVAVQVDEV